MYNSQIHQIFIAICLIPVIATEIPRPKCSREPCPSPSKPLPPLTEMQRSPSKHHIKEYTASAASWVGRPSPTPGMVPNPKLNETNRQEFFEVFFRSIERLRQIFHEMHSSKLASKTPFIQPTPGMAPPYKPEDLQLKVKKQTDEIVSLLVKDLFGQVWKSAASSHVKPTMHPYTTASPTAHQRNRTQKSFFNVIFQGGKEDKRFMEKFLMSPKIDMGNNAAVRYYVNNNLPKIAVGYWKFISWVLKQLEASSCEQDCDYIDKMVQFCKDQHRTCQRGNLQPSITPSIAPPRFSIKPSPSPPTATESPCSSASKRCPFKSGCYPQSTPCMNDRDIFSTVAQLHSISGLRPTVSSKYMAHFATHVQSPPPLKSRVYNQTLMEYAWREAAKQNPHLTIDDLKMTFETFSRSLRPDDSGGEPSGEGKEICSQMCRDRNRTFCWAEVGCKQKGVKCSLKHLAKMMNSTVFENRENCSNSFFCPVIQNCTSNKESCNASKFMEIPCDQECMNATGGKGIRPSNEEIEIFRLKCKDDEKNCPTQSGCVSKKESCNGNKKLDVPLGNRPGDEWKAFCRLQDYICPRVYYKWKRMKCLKQVMMGSGIKATDRPPLYSIPFDRKSRTIMPKPTPSATSRRENIHSSTIKPTMSQFSLPKVTLKKMIPLMKQINLRGVSFLAITKLACPLSLEFYTTTNGVNRKKIVFPDSNSGNGVLIPLQVYLGYMSTKPSFHGSCILKYTDFTTVRGKRYESGQTVPVPSESKFGTIAVVIFPTHGEIEARLIGNNIIDIKEDETSPPCVKLNSMIKFNLSGLHAVSGIKSEFENLVEKEVVAEYKAKLASLKEGRFEAAIIGSEGLSWKSGFWKHKNAKSKFEDFPGYLSYKKPFAINMDSCIAFYPAKDFNGKVRLSVVGALSVVENGKREVIFGKKILKVGVDVLPEPDAPELAARDSCLPAYPFDLNDGKNTGFKIEDILQAGRSPCSQSQGKNFPLIDNIVSYKGSRIGLAITQVSSCSFGHWEVKDGMAFKKIIIKDGLSQCLLKAARIRFVPKNYTTLWSIRQAQTCIWIKAKAWLSLSSNTTGPCNVTNTGSNLFSNSDVQLSVVRKGCDDIVGSMRKPDACGRCGNKRLANIQCPCDGVPDSGAVIDECGECTGGTTGKVFQKRDCAKWCYANGTESENVEDSCGRCQKRKFVKKDAKDCNGNCLFGRMRACKNKCNVCVGGLTKKPLNNGINACGFCIANSSSACVKSLSLSKAIEASIDQPFVMKITAKGFFSLRSLSCLLKKTGSSSSVILGKSYAKRQNIPVQIDSGMCDEEESGDYEVECSAVLRTGGNYKLSCKVDEESSSTEVNLGQINVINQQSMVQKIVPPNIDSCRNGTFILLGNGFKNSSGAICGASCERKCDFKTRGTYINGTAFACKIEVEGNKEDCEAQGINLHALASSAVRPPAFSKSAAKVTIQCAYPRAVSGTFKNKFRVLIIQLDKAASLAVVNKRDKFSCDQFFDSVTLESLGKSRCTLIRSRIQITFHVRAPLISNGIRSNVTLKIARNNLRCQGKEMFSVLHGESVQTLQVFAPPANVVAAIKGGSSVGTCDNLRLDGATSSGGMGGKLDYTWELYKDSAAVQSGRKKSWFNLRGSDLIPNGNYKVKLCVANTNGQSKCVESKLTIVDNSNSTMIVKMNGAKHRKIKARGNYRFRPSAKINQCGKNAKKASKMLFTWQVKDNDGVILLTSEGRSFNIKKGALAPGKNYTMQCYVRARLESGEDVTGDADITIEVEGSPIEAKIRGGREMTVGCNEKAILDARLSRDPDNTDEATNYFWSCSENDGSPCFNKSNSLQRLSFKEVEKIEVNVGEILECNKSYVFNVDYKKGNRRSNASVSITLKPGDPAEVKLEQQKIKNKIILKGYIKTASSATVSWSCIEREGYGKIDMSDVAVVKDILPGPIEVRGNRKVVRSKVLILDADLLEEGAQYLISLGVVNSDGRSGAQLVVKIPSPPIQGEIVIDPPEGLALNTTFTISAGDGWTGELSSYDIGYELETEKGTKEVILKSFSFESYIEGTQLPPGLKKSNQSLNIFIRARNLDGLEAKATATCKVREREEMSEKELNDALSLSMQAVKENNNEEALRRIRVLSETTKHAKINRTNGLSVNEELTMQIFKVVDQVIDNDRTKEIFATLVSTTEKGKTGISLKGDTRERVAKVVTEGYVGKVASTPVASKRKRRNVENSGSQETFTPKSKEEVDSSMAIFDNIIEEGEPGSLQDNMKQNFTSTVPFLLRSLCASTYTVNDYLVSKSNLSTIRSNRLAGYTLDTNYVNASDLSNGSLILLGSYLKGKYETWNCSDSGQLCTEVCVGTVLYHHHLFVGEFEGRISDIASTTVIHPETHKIEDTGIMNEPMTYKMMLNEVPDALHTVECRVWNSAGSNWTTDGCNTSYSSGHYANCHCLVMGNVTVFKVALPIVTTLLPPITTAGSSLTNEQSSSQSNSYTNGSSIAPTQSTTITASPPVEVSFKFPVSFSDYENKVADLKIEIINMLSSKLNISKNRIINLDIKPGSIIVTFTLLNNDGYKNEMDVQDLQTKLTELASNGSLSLVFNGVTLTADAASLKFSSPKPTAHTTPANEPPPKKKEKSHTVVIIVSVCVVVVIILAAIGVVWYLNVKKKRAKNKAQDNMFGSTVLFGDDIKLQERSLASRENIGNNCQRDIDSPEQVKIPLKDSNEPATDQSMRNTITPVEKRASPSDRSVNGHGGVVSVGIGSSASLKKDIFAP